MPFFAIFDGGIHSDIIRGESNNDPQLNITRGEAAVMLYRRLNQDENATFYDGVYPQHESYGNGVGAMPGRVVWPHDPDSVEWDGSGYWWELSHFDEPAIQRMVDASITCLGGKNTSRDGWSALFQAHNNSRGKSGGYVSGEKIAIKTNINGSGVMDNDTSGQTQMSYTNPVLLKTLLVSLVEDAGVAPADITVYDVVPPVPEVHGGALHQRQFAGYKFCRPGQWRSR